VNTEYRVVKESLLLLQQQQQLIIPFYILNATEHANFMVSPVFLIPLSVFLH
jgi:hypothetical protein